MSIHELREEMVRAFTDAELCDSLESFSPNTPLHDACLTEALRRCE